VCEAFLECNVHAAAAARNQGTGRLSLSDLAVTAYGWAIPARGPADRVPSTLGASELNECAAAVGVARVDQELNERRVSFSECRQRCSPLGLRSGLTLAGGAIGALVLGHRSLPVVDLLMAPSGRANWPEVGAFAICNKEGPSADGCGERWTAQVLGDDTVTRTVRSFGVAVPCLRAEVEGLGEERVDENVDTLDFPL